MFSSPHACDKEELLIFSCWSCSHGLLECVRIFLWAVEQSDTEKSDTEKSPGLLATLSTHDSPGHQSPIITLKTEDCVLCSDTLEQVTMIPWEVSTRSYYYTEQSHSLIWRNWLARLVQELSSCKINICVVWGERWPDTWLWSWHWSQVSIRSHLGQHVSTARTRDDASAAGEIFFSEIFSVTVVKDQLRVRHETRLLENTRHMCQEMRHERAFLMKLQSETVLCLH